MRLKLQCILLTFTVIIIDTAHAADETEKTLPETKPFLTIRLVDVEGKPVANVQTGTGAIITGYDDIKGAVWEFTHELRSNSDGIVRFYNPDKYRGMVFARHAERCLVAVLRTDLLAKQGRLITLTMHPECHVTWQLKCSELNRLEKKLGRIRGFVGSENLICLWYNGTDTTLHFFLPPGKFTLVGCGEYVSAVEKSIVVENNQRDFDVGITNVTAKPWILLEGKPAPEIVDVEDWKNGPPIKLTQLRGKIVILEFWGWWCAPCIYYGIPALFKLQEEFPKDDLVIIGILTPHGDSDEVDSVKKLNNKLTKIRKKIWNGKDINFPVAITRFQKLPYFSGGEPNANSKMCVDYGISSFPSTIVIDRKGNIVGKFDFRKKEDYAKLKQLLEAKE